MTRSLLASLTLGAVLAGSFSVAAADTIDGTSGPDDLVGTTLERMRGRRFDSAAAVAVLDGHRLVGVATI